MSNLCPLCLHVNETPTERFMEYFGVHFDSAVTEPSKRDFDDAHDWNAAMDDWIKRRKAWVSQQIGDLER